MTTFALGFVCGFAVCFLFARWALRRIGFKLAAEAALPHDYEPGPPVSKEDYERAVRAYRSIRQHSSGDE